MCGICGYCDLKGAPVERNLVERMSAAIRHRGPDGEGFHVDGPVGLGHRRLSIIDIEGGAQPVKNEDGSLVVVFNGEIYNFIELRGELQAKGHIFKTRSDTEVIVHAYEEWGPNCVRKFNGIFAFALWDQNQRALMLARDHLGVKPLYYIRMADRLLFASEIKALLADPECPRKVDIRSLGQLFTLRYVPSPNTLFQGVRKLTPGHWMVASAAGLQIHRYWNWTPQVQSNVDELEAVETYRQLVEDAVRLQMRSDVPVGLFLSSGVDSGTLLALMSQFSAGPVRTFTIGFEHGERSNETDDAKQLAQRFGADHTDLMVSPRDYEKYYERYLWDLEEPVGNETAAAFYFVSWLASQHVKVALSGQGADEPWAGYHRYIGVKLSGLYSRLPRLLTDKTFRPLVEHTSRNERLRRGVSSLSEPDVLTRFVKMYSFFNEDMKARLFQPWVLEQISADGLEARQSLERLHADVAHLDPLTQMLYIDTRANLPDDLLMVADKTAMANSLEVRVPFLDHRLVEFVETLPTHLKLKGLSGKYLHKKAMEKWLPKSIVHRKKKGFDNPIDQWLRTQMRTSLSQCLLDDRSSVQHYFQIGYIKQLLEQHTAGRQNNMRHLYLLLSFGLWHQSFIATRG
jgi:asparagine synthase (glutamine-hydrolysing)